MIAQSRDFLCFMVAATESDCFRVLPSLQLSCSFLFTFPWTFEYPLGRARRVWPRRVAIIRPPIPKSIERIFHVTLDLLIRVPVHLDTSFPRPQSPHSGSVQYSRLRVLLDRPLPALLFVYFQTSTHLPRASTHIHSCLWRPQRAPRVSVSRVK